MNIRNINKKLLYTVIAILVLCISAGCIFYGFYSGAIPNAIRYLQHRDTEETVMDTQEPEESTEISEQEMTAEEEVPEVQEPEPAQPVALLEDAVTVGDVYCIADNNAAFYAYEADAASYRWEYYDTRTAQWNSISDLADAEVTSQMDEYYRELSVLNIPALEEYDGMKFRCVINDLDTVEIPEGILYVIQPFDSLTVPEEYQTEAAQLLYTSEIPVTLIYQGRDSMEIKGLQGLYFCYEVSSTEDISQDLNEITRTVTTVSKEERSYMAMLGENPIMLRYRNGNETSDYAINIIGVDETAPVIESYDIGEYEVSNQDKEDGTQIQVDIQATDNCSDSSALLYCFALDGESPAKEDFQQNNSVTIQTNTNGMYAIYVMDEAGNIAKETTELVVVDSKAPVIESVSLEYSDQSKWYESNIIHVAAKDKSSMTYQYTCNGMDSGYIRDDFYTVLENGTWSVSVMDAAGNISTREIEITNIDHKPPTILNIAQNQNNQGTAGNLNYSGQNGEDSVHTDTTIPTVINGVDGKDGQDGRDGQDGIDGRDGQNGIDGKSITGAKGETGKDGNSIFIRYSKYANGADMTEQPTAESKYIGIYSGTKASANPSQYSWSKYTGEDGGSIFIRYSAQADGSNMTETPVADTKYIGIYTGLKASTDPAKYSWSKYAGDDGNSVFIRYSAQADGSNMTEKPTAETRYIGTYTGAKASTDPSQYSWSKYISEDGNSVFIRYSAKADGSDMTEKPTSATKYMGTYVGKTASTKPEDYTWTRHSDASISYSDGTLYITQ